MGDHERRPPRHQPVERFLHEDLALRVERRRRLVENEDRRVLEQRACHADPLLFADTQAHAAFAHFGVTALRQVGDELIAVGGPAGGHDLRFAGARLPVEQVLAYGSVEEKRLLRDDSNLRTQRFERELPDVSSVDGDAAPVRFVECREQVDEGRLASA